EKLSHELEAFHPSESLRGPLAKVMIRLATYLASKKVEKAERSLFSFLWSEDPLNREEKKALACYQRALELAAADDRETLDLLVHFFVPFSARFANPNPEF